MFGFFKKKKKLSMKREKDKVNNKSNESEISKYFNVRNTIREGDEGEDVKILQNMLKGIVKIYPNIPTVNLDGKFNSDTKIAVEYFQNMMGINKNGIVDDITLDRLKLIYDNKDKIKSVDKIDFNEINDKHNNN